MKATISAPCLVGKGSLGTRKLQAALFCFSILAVISASSQDAEQSLQPALAETSHGVLQGVSLNNKVDVFRGIPYAAAPIGDLRWRLPQPLDAWEGIREAEDFGPECMQPRSPEAGGPRMSEDCLYLNVWKPVGSKGPYPVMVWIHGGAFQFGSGSSDYYDGTKFAESGIVLVTINYRLNLAGFFAHPALSEENEHGISGNQGIHDQLAALKWVRENISAFNGDPDNVTIFGESAGSMSVCYLVATPLSKGLFHKAIGQSGGCFNKHPTLDGELENPESTAGEFSGGGHAVGEAVAQVLGTTKTGAEAIAELRAKSSLELGGALMGSGRSMSWRSIYVDGYLFPDQMRNLVSSGRGNVVPAIVGSNTDEGTTLYYNLPENEIEVWKANIRENMDENADKFIELYMKDAMESTRTASQQMISDTTFAWEMRTWARLLTQQDVNAYLYVFSHAAPFQMPNAEPTRSLGAFHAAEIAYAFNRSNEDLWNDDDRKVANLLHSYWVNFAKTGTPNGTGLPEWTTYDREHDNSMDLNADPKMIQEFRMAKLDAWDQVNSL